MLTLNHREATILQILLLPSALSATLTVGAGADHASIQEAVNAASDGDLIQVLAGTYEECVDLGGKSLKIEGEGGSAETILNGGGACSAALRMAAGETATVSGLTITNPGALGVELVGATAQMSDVIVRDSGDPGGDGGGISAIGGSLSVVSGQFTGNRAEQGGALFAGQGVTVQLTDVRFASNEAEYGGAIAAVREVVLEVAGASFEDNSASEDGGAIYGDWEVSTDLDQVSFDDNAAERGGAIYLHYLYGEATMSAVTFTSNVASNGQGGAIYAYGHVTVAITTGNLSNNTSTDSGGAIFAYDHVSIALDGVRFDDNLSERESGGAVYQVGGSGDVDLVVDDCWFTDNSARENGGAIRYVGLDELRIDASAFDRNLAGYSGGALWTNARSATSVTRSRFCMNEAEESGGAVSVSMSYSGEGSGMWQSNLFQENRSNAYGGALWLYGVVDISLTNNTLVGNDALILGGALWSNAAEPDLVNNIIAYTVSGTGVATGDGRSVRESTFTYNAWYENLSEDVGGYYSFSTTEDGNITEDPGFADYTLDGDCENDDLSLISGSALIDAGDPTLLDADESSSDIGASGGVGYAGPEVWPDEDGDGFVSELDCDETDAAVFPGADEACDGVDNDCDGEVDELGAEEGAVWYKDADGDGHGDPDGLELACEAPEGAVSTASDCDDGDASIHPGADDAVGDWIDQDCDGRDGGVSDSGDTSGVAETGATAGAGESDPPETADSALDDTGTAPDRKIGDSDAAGACSGCASSQETAGSHAFLVALTLVGLMASARRAAIPRSRPGDQQLELSGSR